MRKDLFMTWLPLFLVAVVILGSVGYLAYLSLQPLELPPPQQVPQAFSPQFAKNHYRPGEVIQYTLIFNDMFTQIDSLKARVAELEEAQ